MTKITNRISNAQLHFLGYNLLNDHLASLETSLAMKGSVTREVITDLVLWPTNTIIIPIQGFRKCKARIYFRIHTEEETMHMSFISPAVPCCKYGESGCENYTENRGMGRTAVKGIYPVKNRGGCDKHRKIVGCMKISIARRGAHGYSKIDEK